MIDLDILTISPKMTFSMTILSYQRQRAQYFVACHGIVGFHLYPFGPAPLPSYHGHHQSCSLSHQQSALLTINTSFKPFLPTQPPSPQTSTITFHPLKSGKLCLLGPCRGGYFNILYSGARRNPGHYRIS